MSVNRRQAMLAAAGAVVGVAMPGSSEPSKGESPAYWHATFPCLPDAAKRITITLPIKTNGFEYVIRNVSGKPLVIDYSIPGKHNLTLDPGGCITASW